MFHGKIPLNLVLLLLQVKFVSGFKLELIYVSLTHHKYQVKHHLFPWFSAACAAIVHKNHFFHLYKQNKCSEFKVKFRQASNHFKRVIEALRLPYAVVYKLGGLGHFLSCDILGLRNIRTFWTQKIRQEKLLKFLL